MGAFGLLAAQESIGGGITARSSDVTITRSSVSGNVTRSSQSTSYGAGLLIAGNLTLTESLVADNRIEGDGSAGGMYLIGGQHHISESTISGNQSSQVAGGIYVVLGDLDITKSTLERNVTSGFGGGLNIVESDVSIFQSTITGNNARQGGAIGMINKIDDLPIVLISHSTISGNTADNQGGVVDNFFGRIVIQSSTTSVPTLVE